MFDLITMTADQFAALTIEQLEALMVDNSMRTESNHSPKEGAVPPAAVEEGHELVHENEPQDRSRPQKEDDS